MTFLPTVVIDVEVTQPLPSDRLFAEWEDAGFGAAHVLVRYHTEPLGIVEIARGTPAWSQAGLTAEILRALAPDIASRRPDGSVAATGLPLGETPDRSGFLAERAAIVRDGPSMSVILCTTGDRVDELEACLNRLCALDYPDYEVVVVDNRPASGAVRDVVTALPDGAARVSYVAEPRPGLSWARNSGMRVATGEVFAWIDDDEIPDSCWLAEVARGFAAGEGVGCVTGSSMPMVLDTQARVWFEQWGGLVKGRGFQREVFDPSADDAQDPLYPLPPFGSGGNCAMRRDAMADVGEFDVALGAGTPAASCEDTEMFARLLLAGHTIVYQPTALVRHKHRGSLSELESQMRSYGTGLTAHYIAMLVRRPSLSVRMIKLLRPAVRDLRNRDSVSTQGMSDFPDDLLGVQRGAMLRGPLAYAQSRRRQRAIRRSHPDALG